jgi:hypothetical protein
MNEGNIERRKFALFANRFFHLFATVPNDDSDRRSRRNGLHLGNDVKEQRLSTDLMENFGERRTHALSQARGEDNNPWRL